MLIDMRQMKELKAQPALLLFAFITSVQVSRRQNDIVKVALPTDIKMKRMIRSSGLWSAIRTGADRKLDRN